MIALDRLLTQADEALRTVTGASTSIRPYPAEGINRVVNGLQFRQTSGPLMRVNHVGEVCAQALYHAQALASRDSTMRDRMLAAARDETDHLAWTARRLADLGDRPSLLNPLWYAGAFAIGWVAGRAGDAWSLGFVVETERQVEDHLAGHLQRLPAEDAASRAVVEQMKLDERRHADDAQAAGAREVPLPVKAAMRLAARVMTTVAHRI